MKFLFFIFLPFLSFSQVENYDKFRADTSDANHYFRLARSFVKTYQYDSTIYYLNIFLPISGNHHPMVGGSYKDIANLFVRQDQFDTALKYFQKAIQSLVKDFTDNSIYVNPIYMVLRGEKGKVNSAVILLDTLEERGEAFYGRWMEGKK